MLVPVLIATAVSFVVGYFAIKWLLKFLQEKGVRPFIIYRVIVGVLIIGLCLSGQLDPTDKTSKPEAKSVASRPAPTSLLVSK